MTEAMENLANGHDRVVAPRHFWLIGILATLWNFGGALDYTMTQTRNESYMSSFTPEQLDYFYAFPAWANAAWALGVWGAFVGSLLLLLRSRYATGAFLLSFLGLIGSSIYQMASDMPASLSTPGILIFTSAIWLSVIFLIWYARRMTAKGILR
ncbi:MAG: hypothetical protein V7676_09545 [Parasphingorhabdus sp.]|uniref:hypothetical protein n=1 Tax=Parasphingorhabdus sp. TaxID=2709688 RepID=UPI003002AE7B